MADEPEYEQFPLQNFLGMALSGDEPGSGIATVDITDKHHNSEHARRGEESTRTYHSKRSPRSPRSGEIGASRTPSERDEENRCASS